MNQKLLISLIISVLICSTVLVEQASSDTIAQPTQLKIYVSPPSIPADNSPYNCIFVQLQDSSGNPARAAQDTTISLSSSVTEVGTVDPAIVVLKGTTYAAANFNSTFTPGTTTITAAATGYATVQAPVTTVGPKPYTIAVYGFPSTLPADGGTYEAIMVQLQDAGGSPAKAPIGGTQITLSCSNTAAGSVTPSVTIPQGKTYAIATFNTTLSPAEAVITAIASDYGSTSTTITTQALSQTPTNSGRLTISTGPAKVLADNCAYKQITVQIVGGIASSDITVTIASADESIGKTDTQIVIPQGKSYALATFTTTYKAGETTITAAATNFVAASQTITTTGYTASKLGVYCVPSTLPADRGTYQAVQVQLQDSQGQPAQAPADLTLNLFSSQPTMGTVTQRLTIPFGKTCAVGSLTLTNAPGETTVTAQASSYVTGQATISTSTIDFSPLQITVTGNPSSVFNGNTTEITAYVSVDGTAISGVTIEFSSNNNGTFTQTHEDQAGYYKTTYTASHFATATTCTITANGSKTGFLNSQGTTQITVSPPSIPITTTNTTTTQNNPNSTLQLCIQDNSGNYLNDALVCSTLQPGPHILTGVSNQTGYITFTNVTPGSYTFEVSKDGYQILDQTIDFNGNPLSMALTLSSNSGSGPNLLVLGGVVAVFAVVFIVLGIVVVRRRKKTAKSLSPLTWPTTL